MMYPYMLLADGTEIVHSHIMNENDVQCVEVHFERPTEDGFDVARCKLPTYTWIKREGFTDKEMEVFVTLLHNNSHLFYKYAATGGINIA